MAVVKVGPRSKDSAIKLLALADKLNVDRKSIRSQSDGYLVPEKIAKAFNSKGAKAEEPKAEEPKAEEAPKKETKAKAAKGDTKAADTKEGKD